ncbi:MAG: DUF971 domain-containing protein [Anaerolineae bacterium]|nr:DUF971 domain-containing protein [Anaerolineae bacterium]
MRPTQITANKSDATLRITWDTGRTVDYPFYQLAAACKCAACNDERARLSAEGKAFVPKSAVLEAIEPVGSYGINILWKDGCRYGIYTWDSLAALA